MLTTIQITLPDQLAREASQAGLLMPESIEKLLRERLKVQHACTLSEAMARMSVVDEPAYMAPEDVAQEIKLMRTERRASGHAG